jgi:hypothetical protein
MNEVGGLMMKQALSLGFSALLLIVFLLTIQMKTVHAYIDLGSGSFIIQMLLAGVFASLFMIKVFWRRMTTRLSQFFARFKAAKS